MLTTKNIDQTLNSFIIKMKNLKMRISLNQTKRFSKKKIIINQHFISRISLTTTIIINLNITSTISTRKIVSSNFFLSNNQ